MKLSEMAKRMVLVIIIIIPLLLIVAAVLTFLHITEFLPAALGVVFGASISILKVIMIDRLVKRVPAMEPGKAANYVRIQHFLRFGLTGILLVAAALAPFVDLLAAAAGVLSFQAALLLMRKRVS